MRSKQLLQGKTKCARLNQNFETKKVMGFYFKLDLFSQSFIEENNQDILEKKGHLILVVCLYF